MITVSLELTDTPIIVRSRNAAESAELVLRRSTPVEAPTEPTKIIWPADLVIYQHPTPPSRFAFEPPEGWKGQISMDQMERRLSAVQGSAQC